MEDYNKNRILVGIAFAGFVISLGSIAGSYNSSYQFATCISNNITMSVYTNSTTHQKIIDADKLGNATSSCTAKLEADYWYIFPQIIGLAISMVYLIVTSAKLKPDKKLNLENTSGYTRAPLDISREAFGSTL